MRYPLVADPVSEAWLARTNPATVSLASSYAPGKPRLLFYVEMAETIVLWQIGLIGEISHKTPSDIWNPLDNLTPAHRSDAAV